MNLGNKIVLLNNYICKALSIPYLDEIAKNNLERMSNDVEGARVAFQNMSRDNRTKSEQEIYNYWDEILQNDLNHFPNYEKEFGGKRTK